MRYIVILSDIAFIGILLYFARPLRWSDTYERPSIIGFCWMIVVLLLNVGLLFGS